MRTKKEIKETILVALAVIIPVVAVAVYYYEPKQSQEKDVEIAFQEMLVNDILDPIEDTLKIGKYEFSDKQEKIIKDIINICKKRNFKREHTALMLAIADIESNFNTHPNTDNGRYTGLYQIDKQYNDNSDLIETINYMLNSMLENKDTWINNKHYGFDWNIEYYYTIHQQGKYGFKVIYTNQDKKIQNLPKRIRNNVRNNPPTIDREYYTYKEKINDNTQVKTWLNAWKKIVNDLTDFYLEYI